VTRRSGTVTHWHSDTVTRRKDRKVGSQDFERVEAQECGDGAAELVVVQPPE